MNNNALTKLEEQEIAEALEQFGLNGKDRTVYFSLLALGRSSITPISKSTRLPLTTVQSVLARLEKAGILDVTMQRSRHIYEAKDPQVFKRILERETEEIAGIIPLLKKMRSDRGASSRIRIFYRERIADIFHEALNSESKLVYEIVSARELQEVLGEKFHFTKRRIREKVRLKSLRVEENEIKKYSKTIHEKELREAKFLPRELTFRSSMMFWDDKVAFFTTKAEGIAWVVESRTIFETVRQMFELLWSVSRRMETVPEV
ncbi:MAG: helix-turn-helix domain-containing protein [Candidatus Paceibacterota bacterium]|jgi:sugar-specific transcriptional regulator TrmB